MSNTFKAGDKVTINATGLSDNQLLCAQDTTQDKEYVLVNAIYRENVDNPEVQRIQFIDNVGDKVTLRATAVTLAED